MNARLSDLQNLLQPGKTITEDDATIARHAIHETQHALRRAGRQIGRSFSTLCEAFATLDMDALPAALRGQIEAVVLGRDLPETHAAGPIKPIELLQLSHMIAAMGERELAARLRRLSDDMVAAPMARLESRAWTDDECAEFVSVTFRHSRKPKGVTLEDIRLGAMHVAGLQGGDGGAPW